MYILFQIACFALSRPEVVIWKYFHGSFRNRCRPWNLNTIPELVFFKLSVLYYCMYWVFPCTCYSIGLCACYDGVTNEWSLILNSEIESILTFQTVRYVSQFKVQKWVIIFLEIINNVNQFNSKLKAILGILRFPA